MPAPASPIHPTLSLRSPKTALLGVALAALAARAIFAYLYGPVVEGDAITYLRIGRLLAAGRLNEYDGAAPPAYGAFLDLFGRSPIAVQAMQALLGAAVAVGIAWLVWRPTRSTGLALSAGLAHALAVDSLCFEAMLVTETLATALLVFAMGMLVLALERSRPAPWLALAASLALSLAGLTKPLLLVALPLVLLMLGWRWRASRAGRWAGTMAVAALPALLMVGGWCVYNGRVHGVWAPSTMTGYRMTQHVGSVMQDAPDRYRVLRDIFVAHRDRQVAETGSPINTIWNAIPDMERASGLPYGRLSLQVNEMSWAVARRHPDVVLRSMASAWIWFWSRPMYLKPAYAHSEAARATLATLARLERPLYLLLNLGLLVLAVGLVWPPLHRSLAAPVVPFVTVTLAGSIAQAVAERSDNGRFAVPFLPLVVVAVLLAVGGLAQRRTAAGGSGGSSDRA